MTSLKTNKDVDQELSNGKPSRRDFLKNLAHALLL